MSLIDVRPWLRMSTLEQAREIVALMQHAEEDELVDLQLVAFPAYVHVCKIATLGAHGNGHAGRVMDTLCEWADRHQAVLGIDPTADFGADLARLHWWYTRLGFRPNNTLGRWRIRSVKTSWRRLPKQPTPA